jgi:Raf kinase inhibitor-like YbhB/YbcL family protein
MRILSTAFENNQYIPAEYTCDGANINPPLTFSEVPRDTMSLALIVDDPDAPAGLFTHWLLYDMSQATMQILENDTPETGLQGTNSFGDTAYGGPCPPSGTHRYFFRLFALRSMLHIPAGASREAVDKAIRNNTVLETAQLVGLYERKGTLSPKLSQWDTTH